MGARLEKSCLYKSEMEGGSSSEAASVAPRPSSMPHEIPSLGQRRIKLLKAREELESVVMLDVLVALIVG